MLTAPVLMLYQSKFVMAILLRSSVGWPAQNHDDHRLSLNEAIQAHGGQTLIGVAAGWISYFYVPDFFLWLIPVLAGLVLSIPLSIVSSSSGMGRLAKRLGIFLTPEEYEVPRVLQLLHANLEKLETEYTSAEVQGEQRNVADPATCSLHLALLPKRVVKKRVRHQLRALLYQVIEEGPEHLSAVDKRALISDPDNLSRLHILAWTRKS